MNKIFYFFAGILFTILVASMFSFVSADSFWKRWLGGDDVNLGPTLARINADECRRDGVCEVKRLQAESAGIEGAEIGDLGVLRTLSVNNIESNVDIDIFSAHGGINLNGYENGVRVVNLRNNPNGGLSYVCADFEGRLFRSQTPCVND